ncbi:hypothetical protein Acsp04_65690 [Actinomadura sp. NBRC 104425]|uniref:hypothetical protein n=1 Tax=Actinomadura sp. NBRC 104425 TaxID=3032204 RepID=UPI0024A2FF10|nr:hypothetical protein [Actinomadura sp. NBRC 104425]GLZ16334.1 hypothetical protein Acsp04_65690 [Actinomadura sp. NBRC 104425]
MADLDHADDHLHARRERDREIALTLSEMIKLELNKAKEGQTTPPDGTEKRSGT